MAYTREDLLAFGPAFRDQLEAQGVFLEEPDKTKCWIDIHDEPINVNELLKLTFRRPVQAVKYNGRGSAIGLIKGTVYFGKLLGESSEDVTYELPMNGGNCIVKTEKSNVIKEAISETRYKSLK